MKTLFIAGLALALGLVACQPAAGPGLVDTEAIAAKLKEMDNAIVADISPEAWMAANEAHIASDFVEMVGDEPDWVGKDAWMEATRTELEEEADEMNPTAKVALTPTRVVVAKTGDMAYIYGTWLYTATAPAEGDDAPGAPMEFTGTYLHIWAPDAEGNWKLQLRNIANDFNDDELEGGDGEDDGEE